MNTNLKHIIDVLHKHDRVLRERYHIKTIGVFGSVARGDHTGKSDIDVLVEFSAPISLLEFVNLEFYLSDILKKKVDLVTKNALKPAIKDDILKQAVYA